MPSNKRYECFECENTFETPDTVDYIDLQQTVVSCPICGSLDIWDADEIEYAFQCVLGIEHNYGR